MTNLCPVCHQSNSAVVEELTVQTLVAAYHTELNVSVGPWFEDWPSTSIARLSCLNCRGGHFEPSIAGDSSFYRLLEGLYPHTRWEFHEVSSTIDADAIADLGCGPGHFLAQLPTTARRVGTDLNPDLEPRLRELGVEPFIGSIVAMRNSFLREFDVVTAFHVLEHLDNPQDLFDTARAILQPQGRLIVSVPNADRLIIDRDVGPLDWPPHHLTRWTADSLRLAGETSGFSLVALRFEPTHASYKRLRYLPGPVATPIAAILASARGGRVNWHSPQRPGRWLTNGHSLLGVFHCD